MAGPQDHLFLPFPGILGEEVTLEAGGVEVPATWRHAEGDDPGPAVLLLHDYGGSRRDLVALGGFLAAHGHTVLAPDLDGHGDNPAGIDSPRMDGLLSASLARLEDRSAGEGVAVVGVGFGGTLALHLAAGDVNIVRAVALDPPAQEESGISCINVLRECRVRDILHAFFRPAARDAAPGKRVSQAKLLGSMSPPAALDAGRAVIVGTAGAWVNSPDTLKDFAAGLGLAPPSIVPGSHSTLHLREEAFEAVERALER